MVELVTRHAEDSDFLILSGSVPPGCPADYYRTLISAVDGLVVHDPQPDTPFLFHLTAAGSGTVRFAYTLDGVTLTRLLTVTCSAHNHITYTWE